MHIRQYKMLYTQQRHGTSYKSIGISFPCIAQCNLKKKKEKEWDYMNGNLVLWMYGWGTFFEGLKW